MSSAPQIEVFGLGLACCAVEYHAATANTQIAAQVAAALEDVNAHVLVLAGTITHALEPVVCAAFEQMPEPRVVIAFGACTISGGPYWDSYSVVPGSPIPVDVHVPGCPPPPESLALACEQVRDVLRGRGTS